MGLGHAVGAGFGRRRLSYGDDGVIEIIVAAAPQVLEAILRAVGGFGFLNMVETVGICRGSAGAFFGSTCWELPAFAVLPTSFASGLLSAGLAAGFGAGFTAAATTLGFFSAAAAAAIALACAAAAALA